MSPSLAAVVAIADRTRARRAAAGARHIRGAPAAADRVAARALKQDLDNELGHQMYTDFTLRAATPDEVAAIARLVNLAYEAECFFVAGDRTNAREIRDLLAADGFTVAVDRSGTIAGCVHLTIADGDASFGMLAVDPARQGHGLGRRLIAAMEDRARDAGCRTMTISVVNLRTDLLAFYGRLGYTAAGTAPYVHRPVLQPCHFIRMTKTLG